MNSLALGILLLLFSSVRASGLNTQQLNSVQADLQKGATHRLFDFILLSAPSMNSCFCQLGNRRANASTPRAQSSVVIRLFILVAPPAQASLIHKRRDFHRQLGPFFKASRTRTARSQRSICCGSRLHRPSRSSCQLDPTKWWPELLVRSLCTAQLPFDLSSARTERGDQSPRRPSGSVVRLHVHGSSFPRVLRCAVGEYEPYAGSVRAV